MKKILLLLSMMVFMVACGGGSKGGEVTINLRTCNGRTFKKGQKW